LWLGQSSDVASGIGAGDEGAGAAGATPCELGLLTGEPPNGELTALTRVVTYEISKAALSPLLKARLGMAEELSESLASRQLANRTVLDHHDHKERREEGLADRFAANIQRLFSLH
jgi:CRP-like cAMP-binding protein